MDVKKLTFGLIVTALLAGCARSPGIIEVGENTYTRSMVGNFFTFSGVTVERRIVEEGRAFCAAKGQKFTLVDSKYQHSGMATYASAVASFRCEG